MIAKNLLKNINIYSIGFIAMKDFDYVKIKSLKLLYLIIDKVKGYIEEIIGINI